MFHKEKRARLFCVIVLLLAPLILTNLASAHEEVLDETEEVQRQVASLTDISLVLLAVASIIVLVTTVIAITYEKRLHKYKLPLFLLIVIPVLSASFFLAGTTVYTNIQSVTKGPVHWHADFEIWNCGEKIDLIDPTGLSNRVGTSVFHEHGDDRIHVEGVVTDIRDADFHNFIAVTGGAHTDTELLVQTNHGPVAMHNGDMCGAVPATIQMFVYKTHDGIMTQEKIDNLADYILSPYSQVPPGDCIIIEFDKEMETTDKMCETYKVALERGEIRGS